MPFREHPKEIVTPVVWWPSTRVPGCVPEPGGERSHGQHRRGDRGAAAREYAELLMITARPVRSRNHENAAYPEGIGLLDTATLQRTRSAGPVPPARRPRGYPELDVLRARRGTGTALSRPEPAIRRSE